MPRTNCSIRGSSIEEDHSSISSRAVRTETRMQHVQIEDSVFTSKGATTKDPHKKGIPHIENRIQDQDLEDDEFAGGR